MPTEALAWQHALAKAQLQGAVSIGNFDGVHEGHTALVAELRRRATQAGGPAIVLTFEPHPLKVLRPERFLPVLTTPEDRARLLHAAGADQVIALPTDRHLLQLTARDFFDQVIRERLAPRALVEGPNFGFGRDRAGNIEALARWCGETGIDLTIVPPLLLDGEPVSSSRVRAALLAGAVGEASRLLGRRYRVHGVVGTGQRRGSRLGFPTANLDHIHTLLPADGVYAVRVRWAEADWPGAANVGPNPTFGEDARKVEVHLIGYQGDLYGEPLAVDFVERIRETRAFAGADALLTQIRIDVREAERLATPSP
jgi:riboflavin kinase/FMN adenylyltransferase